MDRRRWFGLREPALFGLTLATLLAGFFRESLFGGRVLSPADVLFVSASFREVKGPEYEPWNRLLMDPVLQFQPWIEFNRSEIRAGRLPLWNPFAGSGAPHLANGQSAVFDPFQAIAYLGTLPDAYGWMAAARLWVAGLGMFLLAGQWGLRPWGRRFAGLSYPFCGFLVAWLLYPVTNVAVWFPWVLWSSDRVLDRPSRRRVAAMGLLVGFSILGGHVQTTAHVLLAAGLNLLVRPPWTWPGRSLRAWSLGMLLGLGIGAIEVVPLGDYLTKSPVWTDRAAERKAPWVVVRPRVLDAVCTALPYAFGSQRRGQPNLAKGLGVDNLNESSGGFVGLATLLWLAPLAWSSRGRPRVRWLFGLTAFGLLAGFRWFPADNLLRALPVLNVADNRRLTLWAALGLSLLGGVGLDRLGSFRRGPGWGRWAKGWLVLAAGCAVVAAGVGRLEPRLRAKAIEHYDAMARATPGADPEVYRRRAERQVRDTLAFVPRYYGLAAAQLAGLSGLAHLLRDRRARMTPLLRPILVGLTLVDLFGFGLGLNPAIDRADDRPVTPLIEHLRRVAPPPARILGVGEELPPNVAMRYGLADVRNYDSVELADSLAELAPLYPPEEKERTSRREVTWAGVVRAREALRAAGVAAIVGASPPPAGAFDLVEEVGSVWVARMVPGPYATAESVPGPARVDATRPTASEIRYRISRSDGSTSPDPWIWFTIRESSDGHWKGGEDEFVRGPGRGARLRVGVAPGHPTGELRYIPLPVILAGPASLFCLGWALFALTRFGLLTSTRSVKRRPGGSQASGLESDFAHPHPDDPTGDTARTRP